MVYAYYKCAARSLQNRKEGANKSRSTYQEGKQDNVYFIPAVQSLTVAKKFPFILKAGWCRQIMVWKWEAKAIKTWISGKINNFIW